MRNETVGPNTPAVAPGAAARGVRLCAACLHENRSGARSCEACGASHFLVPCAACEALNEPSALRCHGCGARLPKLINRARIGVIVAAGVITTLGLAYYYYPRTAKPDPVHHSGVLETPPVNAEPPPAPAELAQAGQPAQAAQPAQAGQPARVPVPGRPASIAAPAAAAGTSVSAPPPARAGGAIPRVTHTQPGDASATLPAPPAIVAAPAAPQSARNPESICSEGVNALGLCKANSKDGGR